MLVGHVEAGRALRTAFDSARMHHAWLIVGPPGIGKSAFADAAAAWVLARASGHAAGIADDCLDIDPEHPTARLLAAGSHLDFRRVEKLENPATKKMRPGIALDQFVRRPTTIGEPLNSIFRTTPALSDWRVVVIDSVDDLNRNAANAFLKNLEEPPPNTLFLGISHAPGRLLPTIRSRCRLLRLRRLDDHEVDAILQERLPAGAEREALVAVADGSPGRALRFADAGIDRLMRDLDELASAPPAAVGARALTLAKTLAAKTAAPRYEALLDLVPAYLAAAARTRSGPRLARALALWEKANTLGSTALGLSLEPQSVAFELGMLVGGLADV